MGLSENRELLDYFHDRRAWLLEIDQAYSPLQPYPTLPDS
jgi:hypothetical protein